MKLSLESKSSKGNSIIVHFIIPESFIGNHSLVTYKLPMGDVYHLDHLTSFDTGSTKISCG